MPATRRLGKRDPEREWVQPEWIVRQQCRALLPWSRRQTRIG